MRKYELPDELKTKMAMYRAGFELPQEYIDFHHKAATDDMLKQVAAGNFVVVENNGLVKDGYPDGMEVIQLTIAHKVKDQWKIDVIRWHDGTNPAWFIKNAGWCRFLETI